MTPSDEQLITGLLAGQRRALAKAITLIESTRADHRLRAQHLLTTLMPYTGNAVGGQTLSSGPSGTPDAPDTPNNAGRKVIRIGISGVPGAGKSTFIEALGVWLIDRGHRLAVLAVDPSSSITGGSILGDKTRMELLCQREAAFIRPSPSAGSLGGVAEKTREAMLLCEAAGYDVIIVETVGVGQSETTVAGMVDLFCLLQLPNAGDDLQAIKKGIVEIADMVVINKADIDPQASAVVRAQWRNALHLVRRLSPDWEPPVLTVSALKKEGMENFWENVEKFHQTRRASGEFDKKRQQQSLAWMWQLIEAGLHQQFRENPGVQKTLPELSLSVANGKTTPALAAQALLACLKH